MILSLNLSLRMSMRNPSERRNKTRQKRHHNRLKSTHMLTRTNSWLNHQNRGTSRPAVLALIAQNTFVNYFSCSDKCYYIHFRLLGFGVFVHWLKLGLSYWVKMCDGMGLCCRDKRWGSHVTEVEPVQKTDYGPLPSANPNTKRHSSIPNVDGTTNFTTSICKQNISISIFMVPALQ